MEADARRTIQTGANWKRNVLGVIMDRMITRYLNGKVLDSREVSASTYGLDTVAWSEEKQRKLHVCENNWTRIIARVKREHLN